MNTGITTEELKSYSEEFDRDRANLLAMNAVTNNGIIASCKSQAAKAKNQFGFSVEVEAGKVCDQKQSGRCWMFASYNVMRLEIMKKPGVFARTSFEEQMGYAHIAFSLGSKEKVDALTKRLKTDGYEIVSGPRTTGDGYYESCIIGIENNRIELTI